MNDNTKKIIRFIILGILGFILNFITMEVTGPKTLGGAFIEIICVASFFFTLGCVASQSLSTEKIKNLIKNTTIDCAVFIASFAIGSLIFHFFPSLKITF